MAFPSIISSYQTKHLDTRTNLNTAKNHHTTQKTLHTFELPGRPTLQLEFLSTIPLNFS